MKSVVDVFNKIKEERDYLVEMLNAEVERLKDYISRDNIDAESKASAVIYDARNYTELLAKIEMLNLTILRLERSL